MQPCLWLVLGAACGHMVVLLEDLGGPRPMVWAALRSAVLRGCRGLRREMPSPAGANGARVPKADPAGRCRAGGPWYLLPVCLALVLSLIFLNCAYETE